MEPLCRQNYDRVPIPALRCSFFSSNQTVQVIEANLPLFGAQFSKQALQFRLAICSWEVRVGQPMQS